MLDPVIRQQLRDRIREESRPIAPLPTGTTPHLPRIPGIRCVVFDVYGTLLVSGAGELAAGSGESESPRKRAFQRVLSEYGPPKGHRLQQAVADLERRYRETIEAAHRSARAAGALQPEVDVRDIWRRILPDASAGPEECALTYELAANPVWPMPRALDTISELRRRGFQVAVVSNAQFYTPVLLETLFDRSLEDLGIAPAIWSWEHGVAKPDPRLFRHLGERLPASTSLDMTLYVGNDMLNDVATAHGAGAKTVLFAGDRRSLRLRHGDPRVAGIAPDATVTQLSQLLEIVPAGAEKGT